MTPVSTEDPAAADDSAANRLSLLWKRASWIGQREQNRMQRSKGRNIYTQHYSLWMFVYAFITTCLSSGLVFGWPSLRRQLVVEEGSSLTESSMGVIFTVGAWSLLSCRFFFGLARDRYTGTKVTCCVSLICVAAGSLGIAYCDKNNSTGLAVSMFFIGLGSGTQISLQPVAGLFDRKYSGTVLSSLSGAFQLAGLVFVALSAISTDRRKVYASFSGVILVLTVAGVFMLPAGEYKKKELPEIESPEPEGPNGMTTTNEIENVMAEGSPAKENDTEAAISKDVENDDEEEEKDQRSNVTLLSQVKHPEYILLVMWFSIILTPLQYYIGIIGFELEARGDDDGTYTRIFNILFAVSAVVSPIMGKVGDIVGLGIAQGISTILCAVSFLILASTSISLNAHAVGMALYGIGRLNVFSFYFTNIGVRFGYKHFGTLSGLGLLISGLISLLQVLLINATSNGHSKAVNISSAIVILSTLPYCCWLWFQERKERM